MPIWTVKAKNDLKSHLGYIASDNRDSARDMAIKIKVSCAGLDKFPKVGRIGAVKETRELVITGTPYICIYRITGHQVQIIRILHTRMMWPE